MTPPPKSPVAAVLAVVARRGRLLLVRRRNPPDQGLWGFPGGRLEAGETVHAGALRELAEETGIRAEALAPLTVLDVIRHDDAGALTHHFVLVAVLCRWLAGEGVAADDALDAAWFEPAALAGGAIPLSADVERVARMALAQAAA